MDTVGENCELHNGLDVRECFNNGYEDSKYAMSEKKVWERNFALLKGKRYKQMMKYIGDRDRKVRESQFRYDRNPTWIMPFNRL
jgi:hypothetical protein